LGADRFVEQDETFESTSDCEWDRPDTWTSWSFDNTATVATEHEYDSWRNCLDFPVNDMGLTNNQVVFVVVAVWSSGDSFAHDAGSHAEIMGVFLNKNDAKDFTLKLETNNYIKIDGREIHVPWDGYFESLDYISVVAVRCVVQKA